MEGYVYIGVIFSVENIYIAMGLKQYYVCFFLNLNLDLPKCNHSKCYRGYKQTFILLKIHAEMVENNTNFGHF